MAVCGCEDDCQVVERSEDDCQVVERSEDDCQVVERSEDDCKESSKTNGKAVSQVKPPFERTESEANREQGVLEDERQSRESSETTI